MDAAAKEKTLRIIVHEDVTVRFYEIDAYRVAHNSRMHIYFDIGRFKMLDMFFMPFSRFSHSQWIFPVLKESCKFSNFVQLNDKLVVETVFRYKSSQRIALLKFEHRVFKQKKGMTVAQGSSEVGICDKNNRLLSTIPAEMVGFVEETIEEHLKCRKNDVKILVD